MKRILTFWIASVVVAFGQQVTPNIGLLIQTPPQYANNWGAITNYNFQKIDTAFAGVGSQFKGTWNSGTTYSSGAVVQYVGQLYMSIQSSNLNQNPVSQTAYWTQISNTGSLTYPSAGLAASTGSAWRAPVFGDVVNLWAGGSCTSGWLKFDGTCSTPSSTGVASLQGLNGTLALESLDSSVTITTPDSTHINLAATGGGGGVPFNPTTTNYIFLSFSGLYDDTHALSSAVPVTSASCVGSSAPYTCTVATISAHNLSVGSFVDVATITGWLSSGVVTPFNGSFQIISTGFTTTQFEFLSSLGTFTCSSSCGNVYDASYWGIYQTANQPFLNGHGTVYGDESSVATADTNFSTALAPLCSLSPGPNYLIIEAGQNDLDAGASHATISAHLQSIWAKAHTAGCEVIQGSIVPGDYGFDLNGPLIATSSFLNSWLPQQAKSFSNAASGQYWDQFVDYNAYMVYDNAFGAIGNLGTAAWQAKMFAQRTNDAFGSQASSVTGPPPFWGLGSGGYTWDMAGSSWSFINSDGDGSGNPWMVWAAPNLQMFNGASTAPLIQSLSTTHSNYCHWSLGYANSTSNAYALCFNYVGSGSTSNYMYFTPYFGSTDAVHMYGDSTVSIPTVATSPSTSPICPNGTNGTLTTSGCSGGSGGSTGTVTYTSSQTAASGDNGKLVIMNCSSACAYTLPATQPSTTWQIALQSIGSTTATLGLSGDTYNGGATAPVLMKYDSLPIWTNTATSTDYRGGTPLVAGSNVSVTPAANGKTIASTGGGSGNPSVLPLPTSTGFSWINQGSSTLSTLSDSTFLMQIPENSSQNWRFQVKSVPGSAPYSVAGAFTATPQGTSFDAVLPSLMISDGTKILDFECLNTKSGAVLRVEQLSSVTSDNATAYNGNIPNGAIAAASCYGGTLYMRIRNDGTNLYFDTSINGSSWQNFYSQAVGAWLSTITTYGWGGFDQNGASTYINVQLLGWLETNSATPAGTINASGGGGSVGSGSGYKLPAYGSAPSTTVNPSNLSTDSTGNNLIVPGSTTAGTPVLYSALGSCSGPIIRVLLDPPTTLTFWGIASGTGTPGSTTALVYCDGVNWRFF